MKAEIKKNVMTYEGVKALEDELEDLLKSLEDLDLDDVLPEADDEEKPGAAE